MKNEAGASFSAAIITPIASPSGWPAAGVKGGFTYGQTDDLGYRIVKDKMYVHDLQATILCALGIDATRFSYPYQGLNARLIGPTSDPRVHPAVFA